MILEFGESNLILIQFLSLDKTHFMPLINRMFFEDKNIKILEQSNMKKKAEIYLRY